MQFAHAGNHARPRIVIQLCPERRVFLNVTGQGLVKNLAFVGIARLKGKRDDRRVGLDAFKDQRPLAGGIGFSRMGRSQAHGDNYFARASLFKLFAPVGMGPVQTAQAVVLVQRCIAQIVPFMNAPRIHADKGVLAVFFEQDFKNQSNGRGIWIRGNGDFFSLGVNAHRGGHVQWRGQPAANGVQHGLHARVAQGRAAENRSDVTRQGGPPKGRVDVIDSVSAFKVGLKKIFIGFGQFFQQQFTPGSGQRGLLRREGSAAHGQALIVFIKGQAFFMNKVKDSAEVLTLPEGDCNGQGVGLEPLAHGFKNGFKVRSQPVHLVDKGDLGHAEVFGLPPHGFRLRLHAAHGAKHAHGSVQHAQGALDLNGEVHVAGSVYEVDGVVVPLTGGAGRHDGNAAFLFFGHVIHSGGAVVYFAHAVDFAAVEKHALRQCGLASVNMGNNANVANAVDVGHDGSRTQGLSQHAKGQAMRAEKIRRKAGVQPKALAARRQSQTGAAGGKGFAMQQICLLLVAGSEIKSVRRLRIQCKRRGRAAGAVSGHWGRDACGRDARGRVQSFCLGKIQCLKINAVAVVRRVLPIDGRISLNQGKLW